MIVTLDGMQPLGARIAAVLRAGDVVTLDGGLGAGKTTLARAILTALGHSDDVPSPSFSIIQPYAPPGVRVGVAHVDLYRLEGPDAVAELGLEDYAFDHALLIEWPDRLPAGWFPDRLAIRIDDAPGGAPGDAGDGGARCLTVTPGRGWEQRWTAA